jgi:cobalamin transport system substrate-binding protein
MKVKFETRGVCSVVAWAMLCSVSIPAHAATQLGTSAQSNSGMARELIDGTGRHVRIPAQVRRIVSLAPNLTEIIYALGAEDRLVGVTDYSDSPPAAKEKPSIGMPANPSLEAIVGMKPDLVLATAVNRWETVRALERMGIAVYGTDPHTVEGMIDSIVKIGEAIGAAAPAEALATQLRQRLAALQASLAGLPRKRVFFVVWEDPVISVGDHTFIADALRLAGAESVPHTSQNWPQVSLEEIVRLDPDFLVYASDEAGTKEDMQDAAAKRLAELHRERGWRGLTAVREGHVAVISDEVNLPAPGLIDAIEQLARQLHPDAFAQKARRRTAQSRRVKAPHPSKEIAPVWQKSSPEEVACAR